MILEFLIKASVRQYHLFLCTILSITCLPHTLLALSEPASEITRIFKMFFTTKRAVANNIHETSTQLKLSSVSFYILAFTTLSAASLVNLNVNAPFRTNPDNYLYYAEPKSAHLIAHLCIKTLRNLLNSDA